MILTCLNRVHCTICVQVFVLHRVLFSVLISLLSCDTIAATGGSAIAGGGVAGGGAAATTGGVAAGGGNAATGGCAGGGAALQEPVVHLQPGLCCCGEVHIVLC